MLRLFNIFKKKEQLNVEPLIQATLNNDLSAYTNEELEEVFKVLSINKHNSRANYRRFIRFALWLCSRSESLS